MPTTPVKPVELSRRSKPIPVVLDTDIGTDIDDTWALAHLLRSPELDLRLVTVSMRDLKYRAKLVAKLLVEAGRSDIPVGLGVPKHPGDKHIHQHQGPWVADFDLASYPGGIVEDGTGALIRAILDAPAPVILLAIGPLSTVSAAIGREPAILQRARLVSMLGDIGGKSPEYNVTRDISAARAVIEAPWQVPPTITPLDTCGKARLEGIEYQHVRACPDPLIQAVGFNYDLWAGGKGADEVKQAMTQSSKLYDTVAVHLAYSEEFLTVESLNLRVDGKGRTIVDQEKGHPIRCALAWRNLPGFTADLTNRLVGKEAALNFSHAKEDESSPIKNTRRKDNMEDLIKKKTNFHDLVDKRVLIIGLGGGCDIITAYALNKILPRGTLRVGWGNAKRRGDPDLIPETDGTLEPPTPNAGDPYDHANRGTNTNWVVPGIYRLPPGQLPLEQVKQSHDATKIERSVHQARVAHGTERNFVFLLPKPKGIVLSASDNAKNRSQLAKELRALCTTYKFDVILGIDAGGDVLITTDFYGDDRDRQMLEVVREAVAGTKIQARCVVVSPGCDGTSKEDLERALLSTGVKKAYSGCFEVAPLVSTLAKYGKPQRARRTPNIIANVIKGPPYSKYIESVGNDQVRIIRESKPVIPISWLKHAFVYNLTELPGLKAPSNS